MALYTRYVLIVDAATGNDTQGSGSSASVKDSDSLSGTTLVITNAAGGSTVTRADAAAFSGPPVAGVDTIIFTNTVGGLMLCHIAAVSVGNDTLTLIETPSTGTSTGNPWGIGGYFASIARAALVVAPTNTNAGADDHVYVKAGSGYSGTAKITFSKPGSRSRPIVFEGYTTAPGDGGRATYDITATATVGFEPAAVDQVFRNFKLTNSGGVNAWSAFKPTSSYRGLVDACWTSSASGTNPVGFNYPNVAAQTFRGRASHSPAGGIGFQLLGIGFTSFCIAHDSGNPGFAGTLSATLACIADTCGTGTANGGFSANSSARCQPVFCTAYNQGTTGDGLRVNDNSSCTAAGALGSIFANNVGLGINRQGITASFPLHFELYNDLYGNGTPRANAEDTTSYDAAPTDLALDPQFTDAANQDFSIGENLKAKAAIRIGNL